MAKLKIEIFKETAADNLTSSYIADYLALRELNLAHQKSVFHFE